MMGGVKGELKTTYKPYYVDTMCKRVIIMFDILLVEDDARIREIITYYFGNRQEKKYNITEAENGEACLTKLYERNYDIVLLDIMLPDMSGFDICRKIRETSDVPIIFITAKAQEEDIINGYSYGCDDYIIKPFLIAELYAKVNALINRSKGMVVNNKMSIDELELDPFRKIVVLQGRNISLPNKEYELLKLLLENKNCAVSREKILRQIWGFDYEGNERAIDDHIRKLRKLLGSYGNKIKTVTNYGYKITNE